MCAIVLVMFYDNRTTKLIEAFRVLSCVVYSITENYVCIDYLCCQSKTLSVISRDIFRKYEL